MYNFIADPQKNAHYTSVPLATIKFPLTSLRIAELSSETRLSFLTLKNVSGSQKNSLPRICFCMFLHQAQLMFNFIVDQQKKNA